MLNAPRLAAAAVLVAGNGFLWMGRAASPAIPTQSLRQAEAIPMAMGDWKGKRLEADERTVEILETDDIALIEYHRWDEPPVWLAQVSGFGKRAAFHPPEMCYVGSHFEVLERERSSVTLDGRRHDFMRLLIGQGKERFEARYWFTAAGKTTPSYYRQQIWLMLAAARRQPTSGALIRVSTPVDQVERARQRLNIFMKALLDANRHGSIGESDVR